VATPSPTRSTATGFERRAARAELLARTPTTVAEPLRFVAGLCRAQAAAAARIADADTVEALTGVFARDVGRILPHLLEIARFAAQGSAPVLARQAASRAREDEPTARSRLEIAWGGARGASDDYLSRAMLGPYAEVLRVSGRGADRSRARGRCPFCGGAPIAGCRRGGSTSEGAARSLVCALCSLEWPIGRIVCAACHEADPHRLPIFSSAEHPAARIEACETCRRYVKSVDLSLDARLLPEIDDIASLALDLWAGEQGWTRLEPGLAGV
jgi:formate dehydrogenase accessory protein FdhE